MTAPTSRVGKVTVERRDSGRPLVTVGLGDLLYEVVEALADLGDQPGDPLGKALAEVSRCRAERIENVARDTDERYWAERTREAVHELLSLADVPPDPTVVLGRDEVAAVSRAHLTGLSVVPATEVAA